MVRMGEPTHVEADRASGADPRSFEAFFAAEHARLERALYVLTGNREEAEELMQDSFIAVWERWDRVGPMDDPVGYLYRTAMNRHRGSLRRAARLARKAVPITPSRDELAAAEERDAIARAIAMLPTRQRVAIVLVEMLGFDAPAAASVLKVKEATIRSLASQARASLRGTLEGKDG